MLRFEFQQALSREQIDEMAKPMLEECAKKEGATADDVTDALARQSPKSKSGKCLHACMGETLGLVRAFGSMHLTKHLVQ